MIFATALGHFAANSSANALAAAAAWSRSSASRISASIFFAVGCADVGQRVEHVGGLVEPVALVAGLGPHVAHRGPEPERPVTDREDRRAHAASFQVAQQIRPALLRLAIAVADRDQLLGAIEAHAHHDQHTEPVLGEADVEVDAIDPDVDEVAIGERLVHERPLLVLPLGREPGDHRRRQARPRSRRTPPARARSRRSTCHAGRGAATPRSPSATCGTTAARSSS